MGSLYLFYMVRSYGIYSGVGKSGSGRAMKWGPSDLQGSLDPSDIPEKLANRTQSSEREQCK